VDNGIDSLDRRSAVVTGGSRGIGRAIVERLVRDGATVTFSYVRDHDAAQAVLAATDGRARAVRCDLADGAAITALFDTAEQTAGGLDIVVNNAAVAVVGAIGQTTDEEYDRVMGVNTRGAFLVLREAARRLREGGRIVTISTLNTVVRGAGIALYAASKAAVEQFTAVAAYELGGRGITANTVSPGATDTDMLRSVNTDEQLTRTAAMTPLGRLGDPADVADVVAFLVGPDGRWITGQNIRATGGLG
jgi:3-oxoacyl-[acyl-carrier protein] reductase